MPTITLKHIITLSFILFIQQMVSGAFLSIVSPGENHVYTVGETLNITYASIDVDTIKIEVFSPVNGGIWEVIADTFPTAFGSTLPITNLNSPDWAHYQIRITDFAGVADTAYSGVFTILNPNNPIIRLNILTDAVDVGNSFDVSWIPSPSIDSLVIEVLKPNRNTWEKIPDNYTTSDSSGNANIPLNAVGGYYYYRAYDVDNPTKFSNLDSLFVVDNYFAGIDEQSPFSGEENVSINLDDRPEPHVITMTFKEPLLLNSGKTIDIYHEDEGLQFSIPTESEDAFLKPNEAGDSTLLCFRLSQSLKHSSHYYIFIDESTVTDLAGNPFVGFQSPSDWVFKTEILHSFSGQLSFQEKSGSKLIYSLYTQEDIIANNFDDPLFYVSEPNPSSPFQFEIGVRENGFYGIYAFIDENGNSLQDSDEFRALAGKLQMEGQDSSGIEITLTKPNANDTVFKLDMPNSYWGNSNSFKYNAFYNAYSAGSVSSGATPFTTDAKAIDQLLWKVDFRILETDSADLSSSVLDAGILLHLEYTYPPTLSINSIVAGANLQGVSITPGRLIIDLEVVNPVASPYGNLDAACGFIISCSASHTNGIPAYGSLFYGNYDIRTMAFANNGLDDVIGVTINGIDEVESRLTALLSDSFIVHASTQVDPENMPLNSSVLKGLIPDLDEIDYTVVNTGNYLSSGFKVYGNGMGNKMYPIDIISSNWGLQDLMFGVDNITTSTHALNETGVNVIFNTFRYAIESNVEISNVLLYDLSGKLIGTYKNTDTVFPIQNNVSKGIYLLRFEFKEKPYTKKIGIR